VRDQSNKSGTLIAVTGGLFIFCTTAYFGYAFFWAGLLRVESVENNSIFSLQSSLEGGDSSKIYSGGVCITIVMSIMITLVRLQGVPVFKKVVVDGLLATQ
jgi:hypothetical protein